MLDICGHWQDLMIYSRVDAAIWLTEINPNNTINEIPKALWLIWPPLSYFIKSGLSFHLPHDTVTDEERIHSIELYPLVLLKNKKLEKSW